MKILFSGVNFSSSTGPNTFAGRLAHQFALDGHTIADPDDYDIALVFIEPSHPVDPSKPLAQRVDGIWIKPSEFLWRNKSIKKVYEQASGVIFQSEFNRKQITKWWGQPKSSQVIHNGIELSPMTSSLPGFVNLRQQYDKIFVCSANWHPQKRLSENIRLYRYLKERFYPNSALVVLGNNPDCQVASPHIFYAGSLPHDQCLKLFVIADWMIHLAWGDHCPNTVIEAISQGTPVICSSVGGTKEIVKNNGITIDEVVDYDYTLFDYDNPPKLADNFGNLGPLPDIKIDANHLDIKKVSRSYIEFFQKILAI